MPRNSIALRIARVTFSLLEPSLVNMQPTATNPHSPVDPVWRFDTILTRLWGSTTEWCPVAALTLALDSR